MKRNGQGAVGLAVTRHTPPSRTLWPPQVKSGGCISEPPGNVSTALMTPEAGAKQQTRPKEGGGRHWQATGGH